MPRVSSIYKDSISRQHERFRVSQSLADTALEQIPIHAHRTCSGAMYAGLPEIVVVVSAGPFNLRAHPKSATCQRQSEVK
jgi:hypothetical protein